MPQSEQQSPEAQIVEELLDTLEAFQYPVYRQGSMSDEEEYPETFFTFWNNDTPDHSFYDNESYGMEAYYSIYVYSSDPEKVYSLLSQARKDLKEKGWIAQGRGFDAASDRETHTGRGLNVIYMKF